MSRGNRRLAIFKETSDYHEFLKCLAMTKETCAFTIHALCLMTNHFHMCIETEDVEIWKIMHRLLLTYAANYNIKYKLTGHLFENRYIGQLIEDDRYFLEVSRYIHLNPVKAGMVREPLSYEYSSYGLYVAGEGTLQAENNVSLNALIGGGTYAQPGEVSLAHGGILFLDELAEFSRSTLDALRQPLENKEVTISRVNGNHTYPASFMFVAAMNPCPCGYYPGSRCRCSDYEVIHYRAKVSGPIMERVDIQKWVRKVDYFDLSGKEADYTSAQMRQLVERARKIQEERFKGEEGVYCNAQMSVAHIQKYCVLDEECTGILKEQCEKYGYSARVIHKLLRMARTAADVRGSSRIGREDIIKVLSCRELDKSNSQMYTV